MVRLEKLVPRNAIKSSGASIFVRLLQKPISKLVKRPFQGGGQKRVSSLVRPIFFFTWPTIVGPTINREMAQGHILGPETCPETVAHRPTVVLKLVST